MEVPSYMAIKYATELTKTSEYRDVLEFGVFKGHTINIIRNILPLHFNVYGFDTFTGLPEDWVDPNGKIAGSGACKKGAFDAQGEIPHIDNVTFYKGLFQDTLKEYIKNAKNIALLHIDSDLYSSAKFVLSCLNDYIVKDTIILFDEWFYRSEGEFHSNHEQKAFYEWIEENKREFIFIELPYHYKVEEWGPFLTERKIIKIIK